MTTAACREAVGVRFDGVGKSFGSTQVLQNLDFEIAAGELVTILGPSGCGKTTSLRILAGFENVDSGDVRVGGASVLSTRAEKRNMGMVFQSYSLFPNLSVAENIEYGLRIRKKDAAFRTRRTEELLEMCGLPGFGHRYPEQLSGGQQQRVALARALAIEPQVLLLDEPLSALDATVRANLRDEIRRVQQTMGTTTMFITHDQAEALVIADKVAVMNAGRIEQYAAPTTLYERPSTPFVARFVGTMNEFFVPIGWNGQELLPMTGDNAEVVFIRPESLELVAVEHSSALVGNHAYMGDHVKVLVDHPHARGGHWTVAVPTPRAAEFPVGTPVRLRLIGEVALRLAATDVEAA